MLVPLHKRSVMTLFSGPQDPESHQVRIVLAEKGIAVEVEEVDANRLPSELLEINPYRSLPTLVDRDLVLYTPEIIMEYLDERFPHPPLMPVYPLTRANSRLMIYRIKREWYKLYHLVCGHQDPKIVQLAKQRLTEAMLGLSPVLASFPYFMSEEFSLVDCALSALLWRLRALGLVPPEAEALQEYMTRMFARTPFLGALTQAERELGLQESGR